METAWRPTGWLVLSAFHRELHGNPHQHLVCFSLRTRLNIRRHRINEPLPGGCSISRRLSQRFVKETS
jgi:hypothetical protein